MRGPPLKCGGPEATNFETANATIPATHQECRKLISGASPHDEARAPRGPIEVLASLEHRAIHTVDAETSFAFGRWAAWATTGGEEPPVEVRDLAATAITVIRPFVVEVDEADTLDVWASMLGVGR